MQRFSLTSISEKQLVPAGISIRGRTIHWFTYRVQEVDFILDGFSKEGYPIYAGIQKITKGTGKKLRTFPETEENIKNGKFKMIYLTHD